jgi:hypothetical protein
MSRENAGDYHTEEHVVGDRIAHPLDHSECRVLLAGGSFTLEIPRRKYAEFHERFEKSVGISAVRYLDLSLRKKTERQELS